MALEGIRNQNIVIHTTIANKNSIFCGVIKYFVSLVTTTRSKSDSSSIGGTYVYIYYIY